LVFGNLGTDSMSPTTRIVVHNFWEYLTFIANSFVFLLIGLAIDVSQLAQSALIIGVAIIAVLLSRAIVVYLPPLILPRLRRTLPMAWRHVMLWGGLRGVISLALALSLPASLEGRDTIRAMTFGVVLFTLVVQATTMPRLLRRLKLVEGSPDDLARHLGVGRTYAANAAWQHLLELHKNGLLVGAAWKELQAEHDALRQTLEHEMEVLYHEQRDFEREIVQAARRESLHAERAALTTALQRGLINEDAFRQLTSEIDYRITSLDSPH
jgi:CPA1 family monovalent cation:H+ antiporter